MENINDDPAVSPALDPTTFGEVVHVLCKRRNMFVQVQLGGVAVQRVALVVQDRAYALLTSGVQALPAFYGRKVVGVVLERIDPRSLPNKENPTKNVMVEWQETNEYVMVKEMGWETITPRRGQPGHPEVEVSVMQHLKRWHDSTGRRTDESHVILPREILKDDIYLYMVMPYCEVGGLGGTINRGRLSIIHDVIGDEVVRREVRDLGDVIGQEKVARRYMHQILTGIASLQEAKVCHRDLKIENIVIRDGDLLLSGMGTCIGIPYADDYTTVLRQRRLINPQGTVRTGRCMSPEICGNQEPFDGHAVDLWATGVILFQMLTGMVLWDVPHANDPKFRFFTDKGFAVLMKQKQLASKLEQLGIALSPEVIDLLDKMLKIDPMQRLSLSQIRSHPWMTAE